MDNSFEEQFSQNVRATAPTQSIKNRPNSESRFPLIISAILAAVVFIESIALIIILVNYFNTFSYEVDYTEEDDISTENFATDNQGNLVAFNSTCRNKETGAYYTLFINNSYREYSSTADILSSGTYTIERDSIIKFKNSTTSKPTFFYDGYILTDGETVFECEEPETETTDTNTSN